VSCAAAGNCSAGGYYTDSSGYQRAFGVSERNGAWGTAHQVAAALNTGGYAQIDSVSCAAAGNCSAGGWYQLPSGHYQAFVVNEANGTWGPAQKVAAALNKRGFAGVDSVSCGSAGNCSAGGYYTPRPNHSQAFVVNEANGTWGPAQKVAAALTAGGSAAIESVSCASAGHCSAGGFLSDSSGRLQAFVIGET
jgi:hypothetical protein